ncbi:hypothetical protein ACFU5Y_29900 [Streptomyces gardneri]|uniref:hypothetical protein n=1 Tax=Streptomyces gardneri TaxID=66892 RepID=UPI00368A3C2F
MQHRPPPGELPLPQHLACSRDQFLVREEVRLASYRERSPRARPQHVPHPVRDFARQFREVVRRQAAAGGGQEGQEVVRESAGLQEPLQLPLRLRPDRPRLRGGGEDPYGPGVPERVVVRDVDRQGRVQPARDDHPQAVRQQARDRVGVRARGDTPVLVQAVDEEDEPFAAGGAGLGGRGVQAQQVGLAGGGGQEGGEALARQLRELFQDDVHIRGDVVLGAEAGRDEEGDDPHPGRRGEGEPGQEGRLAGPGLRPPPGVRGAGVGATEGRELRQLAFSVDEFRGGDPADLFAVSGADRRRFR